MTVQKNKSKGKLKNIVVKLILCIFYLIVIGILMYSAYSVFKQEDQIVSWKDVEKTSQYSYIEISQMSEAFAKIKNKQIHFVMEKESSGAWHTYLIAINSKDYNKYKNIIDFTYERINTMPKTIKVYGYPQKTPDNIKKVAIKNITKFVPIENQIVINEENFDKYLTNTYLDTTIEKQHSFNYYVLVLLLMAFIIFLVAIYTIIEKTNKKIVMKKQPIKRQKNKKNESKIKNSFNGSIDENKIKKNLKYTNKKENNENDNLEII